MIALQITLHPFWTEHSAVERELLPWLKADHAVFANLQLDSTLLSAKAAVCLNKLLSRMDRLIVPTARRLVIQVWPELFFEDLLGDGSLSHSLPLSVSTAQGKVTCACRLDTIPANCPPVPTSSSRIPLAAAHVSDLRHASEMRSAHRNEYRLHQRLLRRHA